MSVFLATADGKRIFRDSTHLTMYFHSKVMAAILNLKRRVIAWLEYPGRFPKDTGFMIQTAVHNHVESTDEIAFIIRYGFFTYYSLYVNQCRKWFNFFELSFPEFEYFIKQEFEYALSEFNCSVRV